MMQTEWHTVYFQEQSDLGPNYLPIPVCQKIKDQSGIHFKFSKNVD